MTDNQIRKLERLAAQGDEVAYQELWFARQRIGLSPWEWWSQQFADIRKFLLERKALDAGSAPRITTWQPTGYFDVVDLLRLILDPATIPAVTDVKMVAILLEDRPPERDRNDLGMPTGWVTPTFMYAFMEAGSEPRISGSSHWGNPLNHRVDNWARMKRQEPITIGEALSQRRIPVHQVPLGFFSEH